MNENPHLNLTLALSDINHIITGLLELPAKIANPLIENITKQAKDQLEPKADAVEAKAELVEG